MLYFLLFFIILIIILFIIRFEGFQPIFPTQHQCSSSWGYRDPVATLNTLYWQQSRPYVLMPHFNISTIPGFVDMSTPSKKVPIKQSCGIRPKNHSVQKRPVASAPYADF